MTAARLADVAGRSSRSTASTTSSGSSTSAGSATCSTRSAATPRSGRRWRAPSTRWRENRALLAALELDPRELARRLELAEHEAAEIAAARLRAGEADEIRGGSRRPSTARRSPAAARRSVEALAGEERGARDAIAVAPREARALARLDARSSRWPSAWPGLEAELEDVATTVRDLAESVDHDPAELARLEERLSTIYALERRYGDDEAAVIAHGERAAAEAERLRGLDERAGAAPGRRRPAPRAGRRRGRRPVGGPRDRGRRALADAVGAVLAELGFPAGVFEVGLGRRPAGRDEPAVEIDGDALAFDAVGRRPGRVPARAERRASRRGRWPGSRRAAS